MTIVQHLNRPMDVLSEGLGSMRIRMVIRAWRRTALGVFTTRGDRFSADTLGLMCFADGASETSRTSGKAIRLRRLSLSCILSDEAFTVVDHRVPLFADTAY